MAVHAAKQEVHTNGQDLRSKHRHFSVDVRCSKKLHETPMKIHQTTDEIDPWTEGNKQRTIYQSIVRFDMDLSIDDFSAKLNLLAGICLVNHYCD